MLFGASHGTPRNMDRLAMEYSLCRHGTSDKDYIEFRHDGGRCSSLAGRKGGAQSIKLAPACAEEHTLVHEVY